MTTYLAFPASPGLHRLTDGFIHRMRDDAHQPEPRAVEDIMTTFIDEALNAFFLRPASLSGLAGHQRRLVTVAADTISKATGVVIRRCAGKMDLAQNRAAADYMDEIRFPAADGSFWYVGFPIDPALAERGQRLAENARHPDRPNDPGEMIDYLRAITDQALIWYFNKPIELLRFGPILRKVAAVGVETTRRASYGAINKVIPKLDKQQFLRSAEYYESMQIKP